VNKAVLRSTVDKSWHAFLLHVTWRRHRTLPEMTNTLKMVILVLLVAVLLGLIAVMPLQSGDLGRRDLLAYWSAAYVLVHGGDPYDRVTQDRVSRAVEPERDRFGLEWNPPWNPPWLLLALAPLALLPFDAAVRVWLLLHMLLIGALALLTWHCLTRQPPVPVWLVVLALGFGGSLTALAVGQIVILVLLGLVLCAAWLQSGQDGWAGAALLLTLSKPQLVYLVVPTLLVWAAVHRRWRVWIGLSAALTASLVGVTLLSPGWLNGYAHLTGGYDFFRHSAATVGGLAAVYLGTDVLRFLGIPALLLLPALVRLIDRRDLFTGINAALLISLPLAPYGWSFDQIMLLPAIVQIGFWLGQTDYRRRFYTIILIAIYIVLFVMKLLGIGDFLFVWVSVALGGLYAAVYAVRYRQMAATLTGEASR